jgi:hypothetical protein
MITALEALRLATEWHYSADTHPASKKSLRTDKRLNDLRKSWRMNTAYRVAMAQKQKAAGGLSDKFDEHDMAALSRYWLSGSPSTCKSAFISDLRDRAMLFLGLGTALRGDNLRRLQHSDLAATSIPVLSDRRAIPCMIITSNNGKANKEGRIDHAGLLRHYDVERCGIGAIATYLFLLDSQVGVPVPVFESVHSDITQAEGFGAYGYREWMQRVVFLGRTSAGPPQNLLNPMSYHSKLNDDGPAVTVKKY